MVWWVVNRGLRSNPLDKGLVLLHISVHGQRGRGRWVLLTPYFCFFTEGEGDKGGSVKGGELVHWGKGGDGFLREIEGCRY